MCIECVRGPDNYYNTCSELQQHLDTFPTAKIVKSKEYVNVSNESGNESDCPLAERTAHHQSTSAPIQLVRTPSAQKEPASAMDIEPPVFTSPAQHMQTHQNQMTDAEFTDGMMTASHL